MPTVEFPTTTRKCDHLFDGIKDLDKRTKRNKAIIEDLTRQFMSGFDDFSHQNTTKFMLKSYTFAINAAKPVFVLQANQKGIERKIKTFYETGCDNNPVREAKLQNVIKNNRGAKKARDEAIENREKKARESEPQTNEFASGADVATKLLTLTGNALRHMAGWNRALNP